MLLQVLLKKIGEIHNPETHLIPILIHSILNKKKILKFMVIIIQLEMVHVLEIIFIF